MDVSSIVVVLCLVVYFVIDGIIYSAMRHRLNAIEEELSDLRHKLAISEYGQDKLYKSPEFKLMRELSDAVDIASADYKKRLVNSLKADIGAK